MDPFIIGLLSIVAIFVLIYLGVYVSIALMVVSFVGVWLIRGNIEVAMHLLVNSSFDSISEYLFGVVPLFVLMGLLVGEADLGRDAYQIAKRAMRRLPGGLGVSTVGANTIFAAITGISVASAAIFSRIAVPEMIRAGMQRKFAVGVVAGSSVLGMLLPPSVLFILYAFIAEQSVGAMFLAGIVPGLLLATMFLVLIVLMAILKPSSVYAPQSSEAVAEDDDVITFRQAMLKLGPLVMLIVTVLGGIYGGIFTPTEAGGVGVLLSFVVLVLKGKFKPRRFMNSLLEAGQITAAVLFIVIAATMYSRLLGIAGVPTMLSTTFQEVGGSFALLMIAFVVIAIVLGLIIDASSILLILVPIFIPLLAPFNVDLVWFGVVAVVAVEIGLLTPPFGISCVTVKAALQDYDISLEEIFAGVMPFALTMLAFLILLIVFPQISLVFVR